MCETWQEAEADQQDQWEADVHQGEPGDPTCEDVQEARWDDQECSLRTSKRFLYIQTLPPRPLPSRERSAICKPDQDSWQEAAADQQDQWEADVHQGERGHPTCEDVQEASWDDQECTL